MTTKIGSELLKQIEKAEKERTQHEIPVLVTFVAGSDPRLLEQKGLRIRRIFDSISAIAGTLTAAEVSELAQLEQVMTIEYDGPVWALPGHLTDNTMTDRV
jgi:hypothetical protein